MANKFKMIFFNAPKYKANVGVFPNNNTIYTLNIDNWMTPLIEPSKANLKWINKRINRCVHQYLKDDYICNIEVAHIDRWRQDVPLIFQIQITKFNHGKIKTTDLAFKQHIEGLLNKIEKDIFNDMDDVSFTNHTKKIKNEIY